LSDIIVCRHPSMSLNSENNCREISEDKIAVCQKNAGLQSRNFSDLKLEVLVPVKLFQFQDMGNESELYIYIYRVSQKKVLRFDS
jgi:hypothetical protein